jgi:hypothetical protein
MRKKNRNTYLNIEALQNLVENTKILPKKSKNSIYFQGTEALEDFLIILTYLVMKNNFFFNWPQKEYLESTKIEHFTTVDNKHRNECLLVQIKCNFKQYLDPILLFFHNS